MKIGKNPTPAVQQLTETAPTTQVEADLNVQGDLNVEGNLYDTGQVGEGDFLAADTETPVVRSSSSFSLQMTEALGQNEPGVDEMDTFHRSSYSLEDAEKALQAFDFLGSVDEAKEYIGLKVLNDMEFILEEIGVTPQPWDTHELEGSFAKSGYSLADAEQAVEKFDFLCDVDEAKEYIGLKIVNGTESILSEVGITRENWDSHDLQASFSKSGYSVADAEKAVETFGFLSNVDEAKEYIGLKIVNNFEEMLSDVGITRENWDSHDLQSSFAKSGYSVADAEKAVETFGFLSNVDEAKEYIGLKIVNNFEEMLSDVGITRENWDSHDLQASFSKSGYSVADAEKAVETFGFLSDVDEAKEYIGLKIVNNFEEMLSDVGITRDNWDSQDLQASFNSSNYTLADAQTAVEQFGFLSDIDEAKEYIGLKIVNDMEYILQDIGISH